jgi:hypothetical protein
MMEFPKKRPIGAPSKWPMRRERATARHEKDRARESFTARAGGAPPSVSLKSSRELQLQAAMDSIAT